MSLPFAHPDNRSIPKLLEYLQKAGHILQYLTESDKETVAQKLDTTTACSISYLGVLIGRDSRKRGFRTVVELDDGKEDINKALIVYETNEGSLPAQGSDQKQQEPLSRGQDGEIVQTPCVKKRKWSVSTSPECAKWWVEQHVTDSLMASFWDLSNHPLASTMDGPETAFATGVLSCLGLKMELKEPHLPLRFCCYCRMAFIYARCTVDHSWLKHDRHKLKLIYSVVCAALLLSSPRVSFAVIAPDQKECIEMVSNVGAMTIGWKSLKGVVGKNDIFIHSTTADPRGARMTAMAPFRGSVTNTFDLFLHCN